MAVAVAALAGLGAVGGWNSNPVPAPQQDDGWCTLEGRIVSSLDGQPLKKVRLTLRLGTGPRAQRLETLADTGGRFRFQRLLPGSYRLEARRAGYLPASYGGADPPRGPSRLVLAAGQHMKNLELRMVPAARIRGLVVDEYDHPVPGARVLVSARGDSETAQAATVRLTRADERGRFLAALLSPGSYRLEAFRPRGGLVESASPQPEPLGWARLSRTRSRAAFLAAEEVELLLTAGEEMTGVKLLLRNPASPEPLSLASWTFSDWPQDEALPQ